MAKVALSLLISLFLYAILFSYASTSYVNCPPKICWQMKDDDDCRLVRPPSRCWQMKEVNFVNDLISPLSSISAQIKTQLPHLLPQTRGDKMVAALESCVMSYSDALRTLKSLREKLQGGGKVEWKVVAMGLYTDISTCEKAISGCGKPKTSVDFSGSDDVLDVLRKVINGS